MESFILASLPLIIVVFFILLAWSFVWKGLALWQSARAGHKAFFIVILLVNTVGILEILYLFVFKKRIERRNKAKRA